MVFKDRADAGRQLARQLVGFADRPDVIVLGVPRGGVSVAFEGATALHAPLDVFLSRKLGVPGQPELAFGAVAAGGGRYLDEGLVRSLGISSAEVERITVEVRHELDRRAALYRGARPPLQIADRIVILVDDGMATGASIYAAVQALRQMQPASLIVAVPVAPPATWAWLRKFVDEIVCLYLPDKFLAVGEFYEDFTQVEDAEVIEMLRRAEEISAKTES